MHFDFAYKKIINILYIYYIYNIYIYIYNIFIIINIHYIYILYIIYIQIIRRILRDIIINVHVKCSLFLSSFNQTCVFSIDFREVLKFHETSSSGSWVVPYGQKDVQICRPDKAYGHFSQILPKRTRKPVS